MALVITNNLKWCRGLVATTTVQLHFIKSELRYRANPAGGMSEIWDIEDRQQWSRLEIRLDAFSSVKHTTKTIHHYHHHYHHHQRILVKHSGTSVIDLVIVYRTREIVWRNKSQKQPLKYIPWYIFSQAIKKILEKLKSGNYYKQTLSERICCRFWSSF